MSFGMFHDQNSLKFLEEFSVIQSSQFISALKTNFATVVNMNEIDKDLVLKSYVS